MALAEKAMRLRKSTVVEVNPYIALSDLMLNLAMCMLLMVAGKTALGQLGRDDIRYREQREVIASRVSASIPSDVRPIPISWKADAAGVQRWVFGGRQLFEPASNKLTEDGRRSLLQFSKILRENYKNWRRLRIEGHSILPNGSNKDDFQESLQRAYAVASLLTTDGLLQSHQLIVSGKGAQDPLYPISGSISGNKSHLRDQRNRRVELIVEFSSKAAVQ